MKQPVSTNKATQAESAVQQHWSAGENGVALTPPAYGIEFVDRALPRRLEQSSGGKTIPKDVRFKMEEAFGEDFSRVRLHEGPLAQSVGALAATQGTDIHFAPGLYAPHSQQGQRLLGHELAHVVQQASGRVSATSQRHGVGVNNDRGLEREADEMGIKAARGESVRLPAHSAQKNAGVFRTGIRDAQDGHPADAIGQGQGGVLGQSAPAVQKKDSSSVIQCFGAVSYEANVWPVETGKKTTNLTNDFGTFKVDHGLSKDPATTANWGEYEISIEMTPNEKTKGSTIRFVQSVRRGTTPGNWSSKSTDSGMNADRARRAAEGGWRVDRADPTKAKTPFYGHQIDTTGTLTATSHARPGAFGGDKPYLYDAAGVLDPNVMEFSSDAMDDKTGVSFGKVAWGFQYSSASKTYQEETPRMLPATTNWFLNMFSEDARRVAGEQAGRAKWNEVYGAGGTGTTAGDADVQKVLGM